MIYSENKALCVEKIKIKIKEYGESVNIQDSIDNLSDILEANIYNRFNNKVFTLYNFK